MSSIHGFLLLFTMRLLMDPLLGATYFVSPAGNDQNPGTELAPFGTFERAWESIRRGDTLVLLDGVYLEELAPKLPPVEGAQSPYVVIKAKNDGKAIIDGEGLRIPVSLPGYYYPYWSSHVILEGIVARNGGQNVYLIGTDDNILRRCSGYNADIDSNSAVFAVLGNDNLLADCIAAGTGRKMFLIYKSERNIIRRCFAKWRVWHGRNFCAIPYPYGSNIEIYDASNNIIENSIGYSKVPWYQIGFKSSGPNAFPAIGNKLLGNMAIYAGREVDGSVIQWSTERPEPTECDYPGDLGQHVYRSGYWIGGGGTVSDNLLQDNLAYGNAATGLSVTASGTFSGNVLRRLTIRGNGIDNPDGPFPGQYGGTLTDVTKHDLDRFAQVEDCLIDRVFNEWIDYPNGERIITSMSGQGARLDYRYINGTLMDGTGGQHLEELWPWPMEERIRRELGISVTNLLADILPNQIQAIDDWEGLTNRPARPKGLRVR